MSKTVKQNEGLKLLKAEISNFKNIGYKEVKINGKTMIIAGRNGVGKSSFIQALTSPINSKLMPLKPIKEGEERGSIILTVGGKLHDEEVIYKIGCYFSPEHQRGRIVLENEEGHKLTNSKSALTDIIGDISFDIFEFVRMAKTDTGRLSEAGVKAQIELLKSLMPKEVLKQLHDLDVEYDTVFKERTQINSDVRYLEGQLKNNSFTVEEIEKYSEPKTASDLSAQIDAGKAKNEMIDKAQAFVGAYDSGLNSIEVEIKHLELELEKKKQELEKFKEQKTKCDIYLSKNTKVDIDSLMNDLNSISDHNVNVEKVSQLKKDEEALREKQKLSAGKTKKLDEIIESKKQIFAAAPLPVKGLSFDETQVLYNGLPLNEDQIPTSQLIGIGLRIGMALNPNLRLLVIRDGSLLDKKTMEFILKVCSENNYQLLIEIVEPDGEELSIEFIEK